MGRLVVELLRTEWDELDAFGSSLTDSEWDVLTECPGWTVRDNFSHIIGLERGLLGDAPPELAPADRPHVKNAVGEFNEAWVDARRGNDGPTMLAEFREVTARRLKTLEELSDEAWEKVSPTPAGPAPYHEFMSIRLMDCWVHEQDMRRAVGRPGHLRGPVPEHVIERFVAPMGYVVGKKAGAAEGQSVVFELSGSIAKTIGVTVVDGRAQVGEAIAEPTTILAMDTETWWCLCLGRWSPTETLASGKIGVHGDADLGQRVVANLAFMI